METGNRVQRYCQPSLIKQIRQGMNLNDSAPKKATASLSEKPSLGTLTPVVKQRCIRATRKRIRPESGIKVTDKYYTDDSAQFQSGGASQIT